MWIDTHCHLDAREFDPDRPAVIERARQAGVGLIVVPAVIPATFEATRQAAIQCDGVYALGIHPLCVNDAGDDAIDRLRAALQQHQNDPRLVAIGEIGQDHFVDSLKDEASNARQDRVYAAQLALAVEFDLPVIAHVRRSADDVLKHLRRLKSQGKPVKGGIAHAFNGSAQQAQAFLDLGFKLGFGGAMTFDRALQIRRLAAEVPDDAIVLETDSPDIPPHWLYVLEQDRAKGITSRNEPGELPRIAQTLAALRGWSIEQTESITTANALQALPGLQNHVRA
ncbi:MAG: TatD family deoxyribonuclease [Rubrivivax sp.]|nr:MAG: TatD family deoxyribonuclease [Rubrivivax sp.]